MKTGTGVGMFGRAKGSVIVPVPTLRSVAVGSRETGILEVVIVGSLGAMVRLTIIR